MTIDPVIRTQILNTSGCSCIFGVFDGLHIGHMSIIQSALNDAAKFGVESCAITFDIDPDQKFSKRGFKKIVSDKTRIEMLEKSGFDRIAVLDFAMICNMDSQEFLNNVLGIAPPALLHVGRDIRFGRGTDGNIQLLESWGRENDVRVIGHELEKMDGIPVSSTRIRKYLESCDIKSANRLLGHPYQISGVVEHGRGQGTDMGFSTANLCVPNDLLVLGEGVYAGIAHVNGNAYKSAMSVGVSPTYKDTSKADVEVHLLDFDGDLYGKRIVVDVLEYLRPMIAFNSKDELISTVMDNIRWVSENIQL